MRNHHIERVVAARKQDAHEGTVVVAARHGLSGRARDAPEVRKRLKRVLRTRDDVAAALGVDPGVLCPKAMAELIAASPDLSVRGLEASGLGGWRLQVMAKPLAERSSGSES